jgi:hypothetical protein
MYNDGDGLKSVDAVRWGGGVEMAAETEIAGKQCYRHHSQTTKKEFLKIKCKKVYMPELIVQELYIHSK